MGTDIRNAIIKVFSLTGVYYAAIASLVALLALIIGKTIFNPSCSVITAHDCIVDGWAVAGLAAAVLGVGGTILAVIGAVAVAAWWTGLDEKVNKRVDERVKEQVQTRVNEMLKEQERKLTEKTEQLLEKQEKAFEELNKTTYQKFDITNSQVGKLQDDQKTLLLGVMKQYPWLLDKWANDALTVDPQSEIAMHMAINYAQIAAGFFYDLNKVNLYREHLKYVGAPVTDSPVLYWQMAQTWQKRVNKQGNSNYDQEVQMCFDRYQPQIDIWAKAHGTS